MRLIITPKLVSSLEDHPGIWQSLQDWRLNVESFLDAIGMVAQAELTADFQSDSLCGRMNLFLSPPLTRFRVDKADLFWQIKYFEEELSLPHVDFIYGYGNIKR
jgi:hypothetical protein|tara:strand:+ start:2607 stop:2918 length:312 start_codon:yes stop_codon:yes gene_type:complete